jgi:hypothetical protein
MHTHCMIECALASHVATVILLTVTYEFDYPLVPSTLLWVSSDINVQGAVFENPWMHQVPPLETRKAPAATTTLSGASDLRHYALQIHASFWTIVAIAFDLPGLDNSSLLLGHSDSKNAGRRHSPHCPRAHGTAPVLNIAGTALGRA